MVAGASDLGPPAAVAPSNGAGREAGRIQARLRLLVAATQAVAAEFDRNLLYRRIAQSARELVNADHVAFGVVTTAGALTQLVQLEADKLNAIILPAGAGELDALTHLVSRLPPGQVARFASADLMTPLPGLWADGLMAIPVHYRGRMLGVLLLSPAILEGSRVEDDDALLTLATTAGIALESARLYDEARRRQDSGRQASEVSNRILAVADDDEARQIITTAVQRLAAADLVVWWHLDADDPDVATVIATAGPGSAAFVNGDTLPLETFSPSTARTLVGLSTAADRDAENQLSQLLRRSPVDSLLLLPVGGEHGQRGWLMCGRRSDALAFSDLDLDIADIFIQQMSVALNLTAVRRLSERMHVLEDRERIARDLHDHVIQSLFAVGLKVKIATDPATSPTSRDRLDEAVSEIDDSIRQLRTMIFKLNTESAVDFGGVQAAVGQVIEAVSPGLGFSPEVTFDGPLDDVVGPVLSTEVVAVLREAVTNTTRYAQASRVAVDLVADAETFTLTVTDDGVGIGSTTTRRSGLDNLRMRAELLGGELSLGEPGGGGTILRWSVPLAGVAHAAQRPLSRRRASTSLS